MGPTAALAEWKSSTMVTGERSAVTVGVRRRLQFSVKNSVVELLRNLKMSSLLVTACWQAL